MLVFVFAGTCLGQPAGYPDFEIVESIPVETTLDNPEIRDAHEVWLEMINKSKSSLDFEEFYLSNKVGESLEDIIKAILDASNRGVQVRIIADARMYKTYPETVDMFGKHPNIKTRIIDFGKLAGSGVQHAKYFIVDRKEIFVGSQNFDWRSLKHIHELGVLISNTKAVQIYSDVFNLDWKLSATNEKSLIKTYLKRRSYHTPITVVEGEGDTLTYTPTMSPKGIIPDEKLWDEKNIVDLIDGAKKDVMCQFLTYSPATREKSYYAVLDNALRNAAARGVKVKMIVSDWDKDHPTVDHLKSLSLVPNIEVKFSVIPEWSGGYISYARVEHCKYLVVDSVMCWLGTSNWEKGYFYNLRNLGVVVKNRKINGILQNIFLKGWNGSYTEMVKPEIDYKPKEHGEQK